MVGSRLPPGWASIWRRHRWDWHPCGGELQGPSSYRATTPWQPETINTGHYQLPSAGGCAYEGHQWSRLLSLLTTFCWRDVGDRWQWSTMTIVAINNLQLGECAGERWRWSLWVSLSMTFSWGMCGQRHQWLLVVINGPLLDGCGPTALMIIYYSSHYPRSSAGGMCVRRALVINYDYCHYRWLLEEYVGKWRWWSSTTLVIIHGLQLEGHVDKQHRWSTMTIVIINNFLMEECAGKQRRWLSTTLVVINGLELEGRADKRRQWSTTTIVTIDNFNGGMCRQTVPMVINSLHLHTRYIQNSSVLKWEAHLVLEHVQWAGIGRRQWCTAGGPVILEHQPQPFADRRPRPLGISSSQPL